jgi:hypothetical protein
MGCLLLGLLGLIIFRALRRRRVRSFFGLAGTGQLLLYLSNLGLDSFSARGLDGKPRSYAGGAVPEYETHLTATIQQFFDSITPRFRRRSGPLSQLRWADFKIRVIPSPPVVDISRVDSSVLAIGSPAFNAASQAIESHDRGLVRFVLGNTSVQVNGQPPFAEPGVGFVQRTVRPDGKVEFYAAGPSSLGTAGATLYLLQNWRKLARRYRRKSFCVVCQFTSDNATDMTVLYSTPHSRRMTFRRQRGQ